MVRRARSNKVRLRRLGGERPDRRQLGIPVQTDPEAWRNLSMRVSARGLRRPPVTAMWMTVRVTPEPSVGESTNPHSIPQM